MRIIWLIFFFHTFKCFIPESLYILFSNNYFGIKSFKMIKNEYNKLLTFIHEMHHIIGSGILSKNYKNLHNTYIIIPNKIFSKISFLEPQACNISFSQNNFFKYEYKEIEIVLLKIKTELSGYASEEAFKNKSILLKYLTTDPLPINTKSIFTLIISNFCLNNKISDINRLFKHEKQINYNDKIIKDYINKYNKIKNKNILFLEKQIQKLYKDINKDFFKILFIIYEELLSNYSNPDHQKKIYKMLKKNNALLENEIFFFNDLNSLWHKQELNRNINNIKSYTSTEKKIIYQYCNIR